MKQHYRKNACSKKQQYSNNDFSKKYQYSKNTEFSKKYPHTKRKLNKKQQYSKNLRWMLMVSVCSIEVILGGFSPPGTAERMKRGNPIRNIQSVWTFQYTKYLYSADIPSQYIYTVQNIQTVSIFQYKIFSADIPLQNIQIVQIF